MRSYCMVEFITTNENHNRRFCFELRAEKLIDDDVKFNIEVELERKMLIFFEKNWKGQFSKVAKNQILDRIQYSLGMSLYLTQISFIVILY